MAGLKLPYHQAMCSLYHGIGSGPSLPCHGTVGTTPRLDAPPYEHACPNIPALPRAEAVRAEITV
ncbi:hypothetical protein BC834DRAFT_889960 [Gloeopeniophorella convolvens]|nr:hypothetical protein BC834DRAFT_889960 [Gloeopeniophorella convolvens]